MRRGQNFVELPVTGRGGTKAEGGQLGVGKAVKSHAGGSDRPVDRPSAGRPPSLVSYCLNRSFQSARSRTVHAWLPAVGALRWTIQLCSSPSEGELAMRRLWRRPRPIAFTGGNSRQALKLLSKTGSGRVLRQRAFAPRAGPRSPKSHQWRALRPVVGPQLDHGRGLVDVCAPPVPPNQAGCYPAGELRIQGQSRALRDDRGG